MPSDNYVNLHIRRTMSELSRRVVNAAEQIASSLNHPVVGVGHLLLILSQEERSMTSALLRDCGLDSERLWHELNHRHTAPLVNVDDVLEAALLHAKSFGNHYIGTEHLLLALALHPAGMVLLQRCGVSLDLVRRRLEAHLTKPK